MVGMTHTYHTRVFPCIILPLRNTIVGLEIEIPPSMLEII